VAATISNAQRDALYDRILDRLSGIGDVWLVASTENYKAAERAPAHCWYGRHVATGESLPFDG
jgi:hypothetical protein